MVETIGDRLRRTLEVRGMSMRALGNASKVPYRSLQNYVSDKQKPGSDPLLKLRNTLQLNIDWLLTGEGKQFVTGSDVKQRRATLRDIDDLAREIGKFENSERVLQILVSSIELVKRIERSRHEIEMMIDRLYKRLTAAELRERDLWDLPIDEIYEIYENEFGESGRSSAGSN